MIKVTEAARSILRGLLDDALQGLPELPEGGPEPGLRLLIEQDGATFSLDYPRDGDQVILDGSKWLLIVSPEISGILGDSTIDIIQSPDGDQLSIEREFSSNGHTREAA